MTRQIALSVLMFLTAQLKAPAVIPKDHGTVVAGTTKGEMRWTADWTMDPWMVAGKNAVRFTETGKGHYSGFTQEIRWTIEAVWLADGSFFPLQFEKTIRDVQGKTLAVEKKTFDRGTGKSKFDRTDEKGAVQTSTFAASPDSLAIEGIAGILQSFPFGKSGAVSGHLLSNEPKLYDVTIESRGTERLKTAAGDVDCYKLELVPHLGLLNVLKVFFPKTYFWFSVSSPHEWVRYQGLENGAGSPEIVMDSR